MQRARMHDQHCMLQGGGGGEEQNRTACLLARREANQCFGIRAPVTPRGCDRLGANLSLPTYLGTGTQAACDRCQPARE